jgi:hypothetical protein
VGDAGDEALDEGGELGFLAFEWVVDEEREGCVVDADGSPADAQAFAGEAIGDDGADVLGAVGDAGQMHGLVDGGAEA